MEASDMPGYNNCANLRTTLAALPKALKADPTFIKVDIHKDRALLPGRNYMLNAMEGGQ